MIKVNLLKNKAVVGNARLSKNAGGQKNLASDIRKAGLSKFSLSSDSSDLDGGFDTFESSLLVQFLKLVLLVGFIIPLVAFEKMRSNEGRAIISAKKRELESYQTIQIDKQKDANIYTGLEDKKKELLVRDGELFEIKKNRLTALFGVDEIQTAVPSDVWLTSINYRGDGFLDVSGQTLLDSGLDRLVKALKASAKLDKIIVQQDVKKKSRAGRILNEFKITMVVSPEVSEAGAEGLDGR